MIFVFLEYLIGFAFTLIGVFIFFEHEESLSLITGVLYTFIIGFVCAFTGIGIVGYFHLKAIRSLDRFAKALFFSSLGLLVFLFLYAFIHKYLPNLPFLAIIIPLTGGVMGFNLALSKNEK